jgi:hypothetical protein
MIATLVQGKELWQTVAASVIAGVGVTWAFSVAIWGVGQFAEMSRNDRPLAAALAAVAVTLALTAVAAAVIIGIIVMSNK